MAKEPSVSHADLDAALKEDAAPEEAAETPEVEPVIETPEPEAEQAITSDPDLDAEPEPEPEPEPEVEEPEEPEDNRERSKLGRRVSGLEQNIGTLISKLDELITVQKKPQAEVEDPDDNEPIFLTKRELRELENRMLSKVEDKVVQTEVEKQKAQTKYENDYIAHVRKIGSKLPPKQLDAVFKEMFDNHNNILHNNPAVDADINFHRAVAALAAKAKPVKEVPLKGEIPKNLGGPAETLETKKAVKLPKLDEHAKNLIKHFNMSDESVEKALGGEAPLSLKGKM